MAKFVSEKYPSLIIPGAGQFDNGVLTVDGKAATIVRKIVKGGQFDVEEVKGANSASTAKAQGKDDAPPAGDDGQGAPNGDGDSDATSE